MENPQILRPVKVPWQISPSVPYLRLHVYPGGKSCAVTFIGFFKNEGTTVASKGVLVIRDPGEFQLADTARGAQHRMIRILFEGVLGSRQLPAVSDGNVIREEEYDWSLVPTGMQKGEKPEDAVKRVDTLWRTNGSCPDPAMYEVDGSRWLASTKDGVGSRHYILLGHDDYVEIIARDWKWEAGQAVA